MKKRYASHTVNARNLTGTNPFKFHTLIIIVLHKRIALHSALIKQPLLKMILKARCCRDHSVISTQEISPSGNLHSANFASGKPYIFVSLVHLW